jgi:hypothetical protein
VPFSLRFEVHSDVKDLFPVGLEGDYMHYVEQLKTVPEDSSLYNVYAMDGPEGQEILVGTLVLEGGLTSSKWADENLFFRHQKMDDDLATHPEWAPYLEKFKPGEGCPYASLY